MNEYNENRQNNTAGTPTDHSGYQPPQYTQQYTQQNSGYRPPNYTQPYEAHNEAPVYDPIYAAPQGYPQKSRIAAALLAFMFGSFGVHNFYLGHTRRAVTQLLLSTAGIFFLGLGPFAAVAWSWFEGIRLFRDVVPTDGHGIPFID